MLYITIIYNDGKGPEAIEGHGLEIASQPSGGGFVGECAIDMNKPNYGLSKLAQLGEGKRFLHAAFSCIRMRGR